MDTVSCAPVCVYVCVRVFMVGTRLMLRVMIARSVVSCTVTHIQSLARLAPAALGNALGFNTSPCRLYIISLQTR